MARIESVRLTASGRGAGAVVTVHGTIGWEASDASRNGVYLFVHFWGEDGGLFTGRDDNRHAIAVQVIKGRTDHSRGEGFELDVTATAFSLAVQNRRLDIGGHPRRFDEDWGRDEIYARVALREIGGRERWLTGEVRTNTVRGHF